MNVRETITVSSLVIGIASAVVGGGLAVNGYLADLGKRLDDRKKQTLQLVNLFYSPELVRARTILLQRERDIVCNLENFGQGPDKVSLFTHVEFFDTVQTCVETNLCDGTTAREFFSPYANWHWPALRAHIENTRKQEKDFEAKRPYGHGLEKLATKPTTYRLNCPAEQR